MIPTGKSVITRNTFSLLFLETPVFLNPIFGIRQFSGILSFLHLTRFCLCFQPFRVGRRSCSRETPTFLSVFVD